MVKEPAWRKGLREMAMLKMLEQGPLTVKQLATACGVAEKAMAPRLPELKAEGRARETGELRAALGRCGRQRKVWQAVGRDADDLQPASAEESEPVMRLL